jgi:hypothetical protein
MVIEKNPILYRSGYSNSLTGKELRTEEGSMHAKSLSNISVSRRIHVRLTPRSLAPKVLPALQVLGYTPGEETDSVPANASDSGLWLVDETRLGDLPEAEIAPDARVLLISAPRKDLPEDPRILAQTVRPAGLSAVYAMIQSAFENNPRRTPRIRTQLSARCIRADRRSIGAVLSLSEGGCLLRTGESLRKGTQVDLQFALPEYGLLSTPARCRYVRKGDAGMEFSKPARDIQHFIAHFVTTQLANALENDGFGGAQGACSA